MLPVRVSLGVDDWLGDAVSEGDCVRLRLCVSLEDCDWLDECDCEVVIVRLALPLSLGVCV